MYSNIAPPAVTGKQRGTVRRVIMINFKIFLGVACLIAVFNVQQAHAQMVFPDRTAFDSAYSTASAQNWDSFANGTVIANGTTLNGITYQTNSSNSALVTSAWLSSSAPNGLGETGDTYFTSDSITFTFSQPLSAFAIDINTYATNHGDITATLGNGSVIDSTFDPFPGFNTGEFLGFSDTSSFNSVTIEDPSPGDGYTLDTLMYANAPKSAVPEPTTVALMIVGLMGITVITFKSRIKSESTGKGPLSISGLLIN